MGEFQRHLVDTPGASDLGILRYSEQISYLSANLTGALLVEPIIYCCVWWVRWELEEILLDILKHGGVAGTLLLGSPGGQDQSKTLFFPIFTSHPSMHLVLNPVWDKRESLYRCGQFDFASSFAKKTVFSPPWGKI